MVEWGLWEFVLIGVVALVVVGPERLPRVARVAGLWIGRARRTLASVKQEIDRELKAEELNKILNEQARLKPLDTIIELPPESSSRSADRSATHAAATAETLGTPPAPIAPDPARKPPPT